MNSTVLSEAVLWKVLGWQHLVSRYRNLAAVQADTVSNVERCSIMRVYASRNNFPIVGFSEPEPIGIMRLCLVSHTTAIQPPINASAVSL
jgi:hypothetical protein